MPRADDAPSEPVSPMPGLAARVAAAPATPCSSNTGATFRCPRPPRIAARGVDLLRSCSVALILPLAMLPLQEAVRRR